MGGKSQKYEHETIKTAFASAAMCHSLPQNATRHHYVQGAIVSVEFLENSLELSETSADTFENIRRYLWKHPRTLLKCPLTLSRPYWRGVCRIQDDYIVGVMSNMI